jgi:uncharacterized membrane protein
MPVAQVGFLSDKPGSLVGVLLPRAGGDVATFRSTIPQRRSNRPSRGWRYEGLRTSLWFVPTMLVFVSVVLFAATYATDHSFIAGGHSVPGWLNTGDANAARTILTSISVAIITVVGVVFSITILALQLASTQFGPRMLRNFIRDFGTQFTLGVFVGTFVFSVLSLGAIGHPAGSVPHVSVTVALALMLVDLGVLIYFIHHVATSIQLNQVVYGIARDLVASIEDVLRDAPTAAHGSEEPASDVGAARLELDTAGVAIPAPTSGYLQQVSHTKLVAIASESDAVVRLVHRPGHFITAGRPLAVVWPAAAAPAVADRLAKSHATGPHRTLFQDPQFAVDQLVEIAIRALSPAINDTFTALTCIDWLGDGLSRLSTVPLPDGVYRDHDGTVRLIEVALDYARLIDRAFDKIRQAGRGMPAVNIRQLETLARIAEHTIDDRQRDALVAQADMIRRSVEEAVPEPGDRLAATRAYNLLAAATGRPGSPA